MRKWLGVFAAAVLLAALAGCDYSAFTNPIGVPSVALSVSNVNTTSNDEGVTLSFTIDTYTKPGSPAGTINKFTFTNDLEVAGPRVEACPADAATACGPYTTEVSLTYAVAPEPGSVSITSCTIVGDNGAVYEYELPDPLVVY